MRKPAGLSAGGWRRGIVLAIGAILVGLAGCDNQEERGPTPSQTPVVTATWTATTTVPPIPEPSATPSATPTDTPPDTATPTPAETPRVGYTITICANELGLSFCDLGIVNVFPTLQLDPPAGSPPRLELTRLVAVIEEVPPGDYVLLASGCTPWVCWAPTGVRVVDRDVFVRVNTVARPPQPEPPLPPLTCMDRPPPFVCTPTPTPSPSSPQRAEP